jgi:hypothetical protein
MDRRLGRDAVDEFGAPAIALEVLGKAVDASVDPITVTFIDGTTATLKPEKYRTALGITTNPGFDIYTTDKNERFWIDIDLDSDPKSITKINLESSWDGNYKNEINTEKNTLLDQQPDKSIGTLINYFPQGFKIPGKNVEGNVELIFSPLPV